MSEKSKKSENAETSQPEEAPSQITLDWLSKSLADIAIRAKNKGNLKTEMLALNSLARLHRIQGDGDLSLIPGKLMVEFVHTQLPDHQGVPYTQARMPLLTGPIQDSVWGQGQREELGGGPYLNHDGGG